MSGPPASVVAKVQEWESKLKGKNVTTDQIKNEQLPPKHRVISPNSIVTRDFVEDRVNVHIDEDGVCTHCTNG